MIRAAVAVLALALLAALPAPAEATIVRMFAELTPGQEVPALSVPSQGSGLAEITVDTDANTLTYHVTFSGLTSAEIGAHIHGPAAPGQVAFDFLYVFPLGSPLDGVWNYSDSQEPMILGGLTYINIHTTDNQTGELRGQIVLPALPGLGAGLRFPLALLLLVAGALFAARPPARARL